MVKLIFLINLYKLWNQFKIGCLLHFVMKYTFSKLFILLLFCFISIVNLVAQENFKPGYIITNSNDTIKGFISQLNKDAFTKCSFKKNLNEKSIDYLPGEIFAYRFQNDGKYFITKETTLSSGNKTIFLEYLIKGKANIYFMRDNVDHYFIETDNVKMIED